MTNVVSYTSWVLFSVPVFAFLISIGGMYYYLIKKNKTCYVFLIKGCFKILLFFKNLNFVKKKNKKIFNFKRLRSYKSFFLKKRYTGYVFTQTPQRLNLKNYFVLKKKVRKFNRKRHLVFLVFIKPNVFIKQKHKNSRMGKGVGKLKKLFFYYNTQAPLFILKYYAYFRLFN